MIRKATPSTTDTPDAPGEVGARAVSGPVPHWDRVEYGLRDVLNTVFREKRLIAWVFLLTFAAGALIALRLEPIFTAEARILVLPSREYTLTPDVGEYSSVFGLGEERYVRSEMEILKNALLVDEVIEDIGIRRLYPDLDRRSLVAGLIAPLVDWLPRLLSREAPEDEGAAGAVDAALAADRKRLYQAARRFEKKLDIAVVKDSSVITLAFSHPRSSMAVSALNNLILRYLDFRNRVLILPRSQMFIAQRDEFARRLEELQKEIEAFKLRSGISEFIDQRSLLIRQHAETNSNRLDTATRLQEVEGRLGTLRAQLATLPKQVPLFSENMAQDSADTARSILASLEARRNELRTKFTSTSQFIADLDQQIKNLQQTIAQTEPLTSDSKRRGPNPIYEDAKTDLLRQERAAAALRAKGGTLEEQFKQQTGQLEMFDHLENEFDSLTLQRELLEKNLRTYAQRAEESLLEEEIDRQKIANVRIIEEPHAREPRGLRGVVLIFSLMGATVLALLIAFVKDFFRQVFISPEDVERTLGLPVLVAIPLRDRDATQAQKARPRPAPMA